MSDVTVSRRIVMLLFLFLCMCSIPDNPLDNPENVAVVLTNVEGKTSYLEIHDTLYLRVAIVLANYADSLVIDFSDTVGSRQVYAAPLEDTLLVKYLYTTEGPKTIRATVYPGSAQAKSDELLMAIGRKPALRPGSTILTTGTPTLDTSFLMYITPDGTSPLKYQWYKDSAIMPQEVKDTLAFEPLETGHAGAYTCVVSNSWGEAAMQDRSNRLPTADTLSRATLMPETAVRSMCIWRRQIILAR